ncbi:Lcl domain-containing protein [Marinobacterium arenosum]|uniref:Lcl domain-containing protein n=1 Tax=Marinobacterium arenosum TaxID=2862496 RepID=UPI001C981E69|nr:DUF1566 domain-containing protein [Marinobacterium arenosum]MBY4676166.1 DUF1566 domain-containing protein [Marinobacterium arenosum]
MSQSLSYTIVDTGQTTYYDVDSVIGRPAEGAAFYGQDAQYQGVQASYQDNGDGTVSDLNTGLMWAQAPTGDITYSEAVAGADSFSLAGYDDWRLPTLKELYSLMDFSGYTGQDADSSSPYLDSGVFGFEYGDTSAGDRFIDAQYWTSTEYVSTTMNGDATTFGVNFADGRIKGYPNGLSAGSTDMERYVRYVRGNEDYGVNDFTDNGDGTVSDQATDLMWLQADSGEALSWRDALAWAENLEYGGYDDWRLPNAKELQSLVDYSRSPDTTNSAAIDPLFETTNIGSEAAPEYGFYWSGTTHVEGNSGDHAVYLSFGRALGWMEQGGDYTLMDVHGAGAQRSDPKSGDPDDYPYGFGPQGDVIRIYNYARAVRDDDSPDTGTAGSDSWTSTIADETFDGGDGTDTVVFSLDRSNYTVTQQDDDSITVNGPEGNDTLVNIERMHFNDQALAFDTDGVAGQSYRLYKAAFDRQPDSEGLGFWIDAMDNGDALQGVASGFINSAEFRQLYGEDTSNSEFLTALYQNVLDRDPDGDGFAWWLDVLDSAADSREGVLVGFSESAENQQNVASQIADGISYDVWLG